MRVPLTTAFIFASSLSFLHGGAYAQPDVKFELHKDPSWTKGPSGKHRITHNFDWGAYKNGVVKGVRSVHGKPAVGAAISTDGRYGEAGIKRTPGTRCRWSSGREGCSLTVRKLKIRADFSFHNTDGDEMIIDDMPAFIKFIDGPESFRISYLGSNGKTVEVTF